MRLARDTGDCQTGFKNELAGQGGYELAEQIVFSLEDIAGRENRSENGACSCIANLVLSGPGGRETLPIGYTIELTGDEGQFFVTVYER